MRLRDLLPDQTIVLALEGYDFVGEGCRRAGADAFRTRLLGRPAVCLRGREAATAFYDDELVRRQDALPMRVQRTLVGVGGIQGLDGEVHQRRKEMFLSLMTPPDIERMVRLFHAHWSAAAELWEREDRIVLLDEVGLVLCRTVCDWTGVPLPLDEVDQRTADMRAMVEAPAAVGRRHRQGRLARERSERWLADLVDGVRAAKEPSHPTPVELVTWFRDSGGQLLDRRVAAVELLNLLRPLVAVDRFITFCALALHEHPESRRALLDDGRCSVESFVHEVRRFYPFFPMAAARARRDFDWHGVPVAEGDLVLLDLYGTNHDPAVWPDPDRFDPNRFRNGVDDPFALIPQGGGDHLEQHRCVGEWATIALMGAAVEELCRLRYDVPAQDLTVGLRRIPAAPRSGFVIDVAGPV